MKKLFICASLPLFFALSAGASDKLCKTLFDNESSLLSESDKVAIQTYTSHYHHFINGRLRGRTVKWMNQNSPIQQRGYTGKVIDHDIQAMLNAVSRLPDTEGLFYRFIVPQVSHSREWTGGYHLNVDFVKEILAAYIPGTVVTEKAFVSTTLSRDLDSLESFFYSAFLMHIYGTSAKNISDFSLEKKETEYIFVPNTRFHIRKVYGDFVNLRKKRGNKKVAVAFRPIYRELYKNLKQYFDRKLTAKEFERLLDQGVAPQIIIEMEQVDARPLS